MKFLIAFASIIAIAALTQITHAQGIVNELVSSTQTPIVFEDVKISVGVTNTGDKEREYLLQMQVIKDGKITDEEESTFKIKPAKSFTLSQNIAFRDIGLHEVVAKLYDKQKIELMDTKIITVNVESNIGPFDISIEPLTSRIRPERQLPAKIILENVGKRGTDVEVRVAIDCVSNVIRNVFTVFVDGSDQKTMLVETPVCEKEGLYDISASIVLFNRTWVSSSSSFFVNSTFIELSFDVPEKIELKANESIVFPVEVINKGSKKISNLKFAIAGIPLQWQNLQPSSIPDVGPNERVVFFVNITVPPDAESESYDMKFIVAAEETVQKENSKLVVHAAAIVPLPTAAGPGIWRYAIIFGSLILTIAATVIRIRSKRKVQPQQPQFAYSANERSQTLYRIKRKVRSD